MSGFREPSPLLVTPNPGGDADPLGESVLEPANPWLRVFIPADVRLVIGRHQDPSRELDCAAAQGDGVPIHRRVSGGGAVVLAPGMVVLALRLGNDGTGTANWFARVNAVIAPVVTRLSGRQPVTIGHGDLAWEDPAGDAGPRKILGASLRQTSRQVYYLGALLVDDQVALMERYLAAPSREPAYRAGRGHAAFCTHLGRQGVTAPALVEALRAACQEHLAGYAAAATEGGLTTPA